MIIHSWRGWSRSPFLIISRHRSPDERPRSQHPAGLQFGELIFVEMLISRDVRVCQVFSSISARCCCQTLLPSHSPKAPTFEFRRPPGRVDALERTRSE